MRFVMRRRQRAVLAQHQAPGPFADGAAVSVKVGHFARPTPLATRASATMLPSMESRPLPRQHPRDKRGQPRQINEQVLWRF